MADLSDVKVGDWVMRYYSGIDSTLRRIQVTRRTRTLIICGDERFSVRTGKLTGYCDDWNSIYILVNNGGPNE